MKFRPGDLVRLVTVPPWVSQLPAESQQVFRFCQGRFYTIAEIDGNGLLVLDVSGDIDERFGGKFNDIRVEPEFVTKG